MLPPGAQAGTSQARHTGICSSFPTSMGVALEQEGMSQQAPALASSVSASPVSQVALPGVTRVPSSTLRAYARTQKPRSQPLLL